MKLVDFRVKKVVSDVSYDRNSFGSNRLFQFESFRCSKSFLILIQSTITTEYILSTGNELS